MTQNNPNDDDARIRQLFEGFNPPVHETSARFMDRLERGMRAVEFVREHNRSMRRANRPALAIAAITGFLMGVFLTLLAPVIARLVADIDISLFSTDSLKSAYTVYRVVIWIIIAATSALTAVNAYEISMAGIKARAEKNKH